QSEQKRPMTLDQGVGVAGLVVALVGVLLAVYFYFRSKRKVRLSYHVEQTELLGGAASALPQEVTISYQNTPIQNLRKMNIIIWNSGNEPIKRADMVGSALGGAPVVINLPPESH